MYSSHSVFQQKVLIVDNLLNSPHRYGCFVLSHCQVRYQVTCSTLGQENPPCSVSLPRRFVPVALFELDIKLHGYVSIMEIRLTLFIGSYPIVEVCLKSNGYVSTVGISLVNVIFVTVEVVSVHVNCP
jgi:hypothetical protein